MPVRECGNVLLLKISGRLSLFILNGIWVVFISYKTGELNELNEKGGPTRTSNQSNEKRLFCFPLYSVLLRCALMNATVVLVLNALPTNWPRFRHYSLLNLWHFTFTTSDGRIQDIYIYFGLDKKNIHLVFLSISNKKYMKNTFWLVILRVSFTLIVTVGKIIVFGDLKNDLSWVLCLTSHSRCDITD